MGRGNREVKNSNAIAAVLITAMFTALQDAMATEYTVGDATGWDFAPTTSYYSDWATGLKFLPGDKLVFKYLPSAHNVQEVTGADYTACNGVSPIAEYETGNDIVTLQKPGTQYYICGFLGHCDQGGMKMKTTVLAANASSSSPSPTKPPQLPSPMASIIPQLPGGETPPPRSASHEHGHRTPSPAAAPFSTPGGHSRGAPSPVPVRLARLVVLSLGAASVSLSW